jgi:hypothetical protein
LAHLPPAASRARSSASSINCNETKSALAVVGG